MSLRVFGRASSISTWVRNFWLENMGASTTCWRIYDNITSMWIWRNINHYIVFLVQRQQSWYIIFWWGLTITQDFHYSVFACESSLPYCNHSGIACMTNIVIVKPQKVSLSKPKCEATTRHDIIPTSWYSIHSTIY